MNRIFVFGSNLAGRHGKGAALYARENHGAIYGIGVGRQGNSYAIPTKDSFLRTLDLESIRYHIDTFIAYAKVNPELTFDLTPIGCGLAGYSKDQIRPLLTPLPDNVLLTKEWYE